MLPFTAQKKMLGLDLDIEIGVDWCGLMDRVHGPLRDCTLCTKARGENRLHSGRGVQPAAHGPHASQDGCECGPTQNRKFP